MPLHVLKQSQLSQRFTLMTHDSNGHLKTLFMNVLSLSIALGMNENFAAQRSALKNAYRLAFESEFKFTSTPNQHLGQQFMSQNIFRNSLIYIAPWDKLQTIIAFILFINTHTVVVFKY